jgi:hypothetical protein
MSEPFDLDAVVADGEGEPFRFTWGGKEFSLPPLIGLPIDRQITIVEVIEKLDGKAEDVTAILNALTLVVGQEMLGELSAARPLSTVGVVRLLGAWMAHQRPGKSRASSASSVGTAKPSKPTSRSTRARRTS